MPLAKTPTSSLTASQLLINRFWYRTKAGLKWLFFGGTPEASTAWSPITKLPQEIVETILSYFIYDKYTLLACSLTCYSWYIATVSRLHHSLTTDNEIWPRSRREKYLWPRPLKRSYELGLLPLVKRFRIRLHHYSNPFGPDQLRGRSMRYFSAFTHLQELGIDYLEVSRFMPNIQQFFGHLSPTLRFLALQKPNGSCRQILYFIGLFPNLQDFKLQHDFTQDEQESAADATLIPLSTPPLRGWLTLTCCKKGILVKNMITLFGGLRFRYMDLFGVTFVRLLLGACTETLETLRFYPTDPCVGGSPVLHHFNLSQHRSLRTLEITARSIPPVGGWEGIGLVPNKSDFPRVSGFLKTVISSVASSVSLDVVVIYRDILPLETTLTRYSQWCHCSPHNSRSRLPMDEDIFESHLEVFRNMHAMRDFRLVLCVDNSDCMLMYGMWIMKRIASTAMMKGGFDFLHCKPLMICERRLPRTRQLDSYLGECRGWDTSASVL